MGADFDQTWNGALGYKSVKVDGGIVKGDGGIKK